MKILIALFVLGFVGFEAYAKPLLGFSDKETSEISNCHGLSCPSGTSACSRTSETTKDKASVVIVTQCEDISGNVLNSKTETVRNSFPDTQISSFSFTGHFTFPSDGVHNVRVGSTHETNNNIRNSYPYSPLDSQIETFD